MSEKKLVVDQLRINFEGIFSAHDLYKVIDAWLYEKGYDRLEKKHVEMVTPNGKDIELELRPWKKLTDYAKKQIRVRLFMKGLSVVPVDRDGMKINMNKGTLMVIFDAFLETDYEHRWEVRPTYYFIRYLFDKYIYKFYTDRFQADLVDDVHHLHQNIKSYLNLYKY